MDEIVPYDVEQDLDDILISFIINERIIRDDYKENNFSWRASLKENGLMREHTIKESIKNKSKGLYNFHLIIKSVLIN